MGRAGPWLLAIAATLLAACGDKSPDDGYEHDLKTMPNAIVVTTTEGDELTFTDFSVRCRPTHEDDGTSWSETVMALAGEGGADPMADRKVPAMYIEADAGATDGSTVTLPHYDDFGQEETFVSVFVTRAGTATELSSAVEETAGEIEVVRAGCDPEPHLEVRIDATLHSEYIDGGTATAVGSMSSG